MHNRTYRCNLRFTPTAKMRLENRLAGGTFCYNNCTLKNKSNTVTDLQSREQHAIGEFLGVEVRHQET
jgi:hypothetical protein